MIVEVTSPTGGDRVEDVEFLGLDTSEGRIGVLNNHADLIAQVRAGAVRFQGAGKDRVAICGEGYIRIQGGDVHLSVEHWAAEAPDVESARERIEELAEVLSDDELSPRARDKARREVDFLEAALALAERG